MGCEKEELVKSCFDKGRVREGAYSLEYAPVCGCDGKTYGNECAADMAGITSWTEGAFN